MKTFHVSIDLLRQQCAALNRHVMPDLDSPRPEWYEGLDSMLAEIEIAMADGHDVLLTRNGGEE